MSVLELLMPWKTTTEAKTNDPVLTMLKDARANVQRSHTSLGYITAEGSVCAVGAVMKADGAKPKHGYSPWWGSNKWQFSDPAIESLMLLDKAASTIYDQGDSEPHKYPGRAVERVDITHGKEGTLACYDAAIARVEEMVA
jgi:hypothetical protein